MLINIVPHWLAALIKYILKQKTKKWKDVVCLYKIYVHSVFEMLRLWHFDFKLLQIKSQI